MGNEIAWQNVVQITAYKEDWLTTDEIYISMKFNDRQNFNLNESSPEWEQFVIQMEDNLQIKPNWLEDVTFPPFQRKETILYMKRDLHV